MAVWVIPGRNPPKIGFLMTWLIYRFILMWYSRSQLNCHSDLITWLQGDPIPFIFLAKMDETWYISHLALKVGIIFHGPEFFKDKVSWFYGYSYKFSPIFVSKECIFHQSWALWCQVITIREPFSLLLWKIFLKKWSLFDYQKCKNLRWYQRLL